MTETVKNPTKTLLTTNSAEWKWEAMDADDSGQAAFFPNYADMTVHIKGVFNGGTVTLYGSNDIVAVRADIAAGTLFGSATAEWVTLVDPQGNGIAKTSAAIETILENPAYILPVVTGGGGTTAIEVSIVAHQVR